MMIRETSIHPESFEEILLWLNPDRDIAAEMYVQLRHDLAKIFIWAKCVDAEGLTDEVFDRVAKKVHDLRPIYEGDPRLYFRAVAKNLIRETVKKFKKHVSLEDVDLSLKKAIENDEESLEIHECLTACLTNLSSEKRDLILDYYAKDKQAKIKSRNELAERYGTSVETLRVKVYRIRQSILDCVERCLKQKIH